NVLQVMCDITIAKESAIFRQVGPMMGSFDAGFGTWYLEDLVGKKKAKEIWFRNPRLSAREALELGMINQVVPDAELKAATHAMALEIADRGAFALASIKTAFSARHGGVGGLARLAHDLLLRRRAVARGYAVHAARRARGASAGGVRVARCGAAAHLGGTAGDRRCGRGRSRRGRAEARRADRGMAAEPGRCGRGIPRLLAP